MKRRVLISTGSAVLTSLIVFVVFNVEYIRAAVARYPEQNSMAGLAAFVYGVPIAAAGGLIGFAVIFILCKPRLAKQPPTGSA